jgi:hypothetical protein
MSEAFPARRALAVMVRWRLAKTVVPSRTTDVPYVPFGDGSLRVTEPAVGDGRCWANG